MDTLLLVDDDVSLLESLTMHFEEAEKDGQPRFQVVTATTAAAGLEKARECAPALVVLDMMLPDRSGLDLLGEMKAVCGDAPIVLVTAYHDMESTIRAMKLGAFDYIHKPFADPAALDLVIHRALSVRQLSRRAASAELEMIAPARLGDLRRADAGDAAAGEGDRQGRRRAAGHRAGDRRVRDREGAGRPGHPQLLVRRAAPVRGHQLLGHRRDPARVRALRPRARRLHRRDHQQAGQVRGGGGRDGLPRRDR